MKLTEELDRISWYSRQGKRVENLAHLLDVELLRHCYQEIEPNKAAGIDEVTKVEYGKNLEDNLADLVRRLKANAYWPQPSLRKYIPKPGTNKMRPIGISCFEDKLVEKGIAIILDRVYECKFLNCSYGFRHFRNCHLAVSRLLKCIYERTSYIVEADIRSFFDTIDHDKAIGFLEQDIADKRFIEIIRRGLKQGHFEDGIYYDSTEGTVQGSGYSPVLANVYLHYVLDTWIYRDLTRGDPRDRLNYRFELVRYADDFVVCFASLRDAEKFYEMLPKRFAEYGLTLAPEKTKILPFGRFAAQNMARYGKRFGYEDCSDLPTFDFLGFTFYNSTKRTTYAAGKPQYTVKVKSIGKRMRTKLKALSQKIKAIRNMRLKDLVRWVNQVLVGYFNYYAVTCNSRCVGSFRYHVTRIIFKWMNRRSQRKSFTWEQFNAILGKYPLAPANIRVNIYDYFNAYVKSRNILTQW